MAKESFGIVEMSVTIAKAILHNRKLRRKLGLQLVIIVMTLFSLGVFVINDWLESEPLAFALLWGAVFFLTVMLMVLALYDALRSIQEIKNEHNKSQAQDMKTIAELLRQAEEEIDKKNADKDSE